MDRFGRRPLLLWGSFFMTIAHLIIAILVGKFSDNWPAHRSAGWISVGFVRFSALGILICFIAISNLQIVAVLYAQLRRILGPRAMGIAF